MSTRGPIANRPHGLTIRRSWRWLLGLLALLLAGLIGWLIHGTRTITHSVTQLTPPATIYQDTQAGAVAAVQAELAQLGSQPPLRPAAGTHPGPGQVNTNWNLLYRVTSYTPATAVIETWRFSLAVGYGYTVQDWTFVSTSVVWRTNRWAANRAPRIIADGTPPPSDTTGARDTSFGALLSQFRRFPGAS